jgi:cytochrome P450
VSWVPALGAWLVTRRDLAVRAMSDAATFTVDDERFSTAQVVGRSMLDTDGSEHDRHRRPFASPFRADLVRSRLSELVRTEADRLLDAIQAEGAADLRRGLSAPLAATVVTRALGLDAVADDVLAWYDAIVDAVSQVTAGGTVTPAAQAAVASIRAEVEEAIGRGPASSLVGAAVREPGALTRDEAVSNAAVIMFGGIETTDGMIANAILHLLLHPDQATLVAADPGLLPAAVDESLRLEPAAAMVDRYARRDVSIGGAEIRRGEPVTVSIAAANRDPATFPHPDRFDVRRASARRHVAFARGPHVCLGMHLARLEAHTAIRRVLERLPGLRLDASPAEAAPRGLVFRKPPVLPVRWD